MTTARLTAEQCHFFHQNGFVVAKGIFKAQLEDLLQWTKEVTELPEVPGKYMMYFEQSQLNQQRIISRIENFIPFHQGMAGFCLGELQQCCDQLFNETSVLFKDKINFKLPGGDGYKAHQDSQAGWLTYAPIHITAMVALDTVNASNGRLEMVAAHHQQGLITPEWQPIPDDVCEKMTWLGIDCEPGDAIFFDSFAPHRSSANLSPDQRRILYITYNKLADGDSREQYYQDKRENYPPDIERDPSKDYRYKV